MPINVKTVFIFQDQSGTGWSEVHYWSTTSPTVNLGDRLTNAVDVVAPARQVLLSADCVCVGARVSYPVANGNASLSKSFYKQGNLELSGVNPASSLAVKFTDASNTRKKITHLRGFWDLIEINGEYHPEAGAPYGWETKFNAWKDALIGGNYGWLTRSTTASSQGVVSGYEEGEDGRVTFALANISGAALVPGQIAEFRFSRINNSQSVLNTQILCQVISAGVVQTTQPFACGPFTGQGRFSLRQTEFVKYSQVYDVKLGRRPQGKVLGQLPGRGSRRQRT